MSHSWCAAARKARAQTTRRRQTRRSPPVTPPQALTQEARGLNDAFLDLPVGALCLKHTLQSTAMVALGLLEEIPSHEG